MLQGQYSIFDYLPTNKDKELLINNKIRLIELFAGYGSQAMALKRIGADFEHHFVCEFDKYAIKSYNAVHGTNFDVTDIRNVKGVDLGVVDCDTFTYLLTYLLIPLYRFISSWKTSWYE